MLLALALAAGLNVSPVQIWLSPDASKTLLTLRNDGDAEARYQISVNTWDEEQGGMKLGATEAIVFSPTLLQLKPGQSTTGRKIVLVFDADISLVEARNMNAAHKISGP